MPFFFKLFLLTEQPTHKVGIIESRIPATMITSRKLNVFHISTFLLQSPVCRTRTFRCNHIVSITVENTKLYRLGSFQARHIYCTANRHSSSKYLRETDNHVKGSHSSHRKSNDINTRFINLRHCQISIQQILHCLKNQDRYIFFHSYENR